VEASRAARPEDMERCAVLVADALVEFAARRGGADLGPLDPTDLLRTWSAIGEDRAFLVGTFEDAIVGFAAGSVERDGTEPIGRVDCCYVEPDARTVGVGATLIGELVRWFDMRGCTALDALALPGDRSTKQLLEAAGFKTRLLVLRRSLR
jgi:GNAT superfamily N-acetyltransferase